MLRHKNIDRICCIVLAFTLLLTCGYMGAAATGVITGECSLGYEDRLFDQSRVHTIDIVMDDWEGFLENCTSEEYSACTVVIDGESFGNAAIRGKGNTSLSSVKSYGNDRYSFKVEFDHYQSGKTYHGLDKLSLNNLIQDKTYLKDYLAYTLMNKMGVAAPLCSFAQINVNGEPWGLYLAVEAVEDSFLSRNYGNDAGDLYKPDSMSFGGGRGNGRDFDMEAFAEQLESDFGLPEGMEQPQMPGAFNPAQPGNFIPMKMAGGFDHTQMMAPAEDADGSERKNRDFGGRGSSDVMLQYIDDEPSSYSNIFNNTKTDVTDADQQRLIASLKKLTEGTQIESAVDTEAVIRYLVVHNFLCNGDSYTGGMVHNYYLHEEDGVLSMIPWDYNLAFGAFNMGGEMGSGATSVVNSPIDSPVTSGEISSRPMIAWIFENEAYLQRYHELYAEFVESVFESGWLDTEMDRLSELLTPYVEAETRAFFTAEQFAAGVAELKEFCELRAQSIAGQLDGSIPSTTEEQRTDSSALVDATGVDLNAMGEFGMGGGRGGEDMAQRGMFGKKSERMNMNEAAEAENGAESATAPEQSESAAEERDAMTEAAAQMPPDDMVGMPANGWMTPPEGMGGVPAKGGMMGQRVPMDAVQNQETPSDDASQSDQSAVVSEKSAEQAVPEMSDGLSLTGNTEKNLWMLGGCSALLLAAIVFVKFYKVNQ